MANYSYFLKSFFITGLLAAVVVIALHGMATDSSFFSWSMFSYRFEYSINYTVQHENGTTEALTEKELQFAKQKGSSYYKVGDLMAQVRSYIKYIYDQRQSSDIQIEAEVQYAINFKETKKEVLIYPEQ